MILGDLFFHHQIVLFDKQNNRIGFVNNFKIVDLYPSADTVYLIMDVLAVCLLLAALCILVMRKKNRGNTINCQLR